MLNKSRERVFKIMSILLIGLMSACIVSGYKTVQAAQSTLDEEERGYAITRKVEVCKEEDTALPTAGVPATTSFNEKEPEITISEVTYEKYVNSVINIRQEPNTDCEVLGKYVPGDKITITGEIDQNDFVRINYKGREAFVHSEYLSDEEPVAKWQGPTINRWCGTVHGPSGKETYYNLPMEGCIRLARSYGISGTYWVRADGCKMLGNYIMVATDTRRWPKGTVLETSLGTALVVDHCGSATRYSGRWIDIAVNW